jgi:hypothetical protein
MTAFQGFMAGLSLGLLIVGSLALICVNNRRHRPRRRHRPQDWEEEFFEPAPVRRGPPPVATSMLINRKEIRL